MAALLGAFAVTLWVGPLGAERVNDLPIYAAYAAPFLDGMLPYRDVAFEYPPLAAPFLALPGIAGTGYDTYRLAFAAMAFLARRAVVLFLCGAHGGADRRRPGRAWSPSRSRRC